MDKYIKRIQTRLSRQGFSFTKDQIRGVYSAFVKDVDNPTEEEMAGIINKMKFQHKFTSQTVTEEPAEEGLAVTSQAIEIEKPAIIEITPDFWETLQPPAEEPQPVDKPVGETSAIAPAPQDEPSPESALAKSESQATGGISQREMTQAISQAVQQVGEANNAEAIQLLTALASELSADISDVQEMAAALVTAYLNKRQSILATTINTINQCRSAQSESFQKGLNDDFFGQKRKNKEAFLTSVNAMFN